MVKHQLNLSKGNFPDFIIVLAHIRLKGTGRQ